MLSSSPRSRSSTSSPSSSGDASALAGSRLGPSLGNDSSDGRTTANDREAGLPPSPLHRLGYYSPRGTGAKQPSFHFTRSRRHLGVQQSTACPPPSQASRLLSYADSGSGEESHASSNSAYSPSSIPCLPARHSSLSTSPSSTLGRRILLNDSVARTATLTAQRENDTMIYLETTGHVVYSCSHCRTHLSSHEDILSKSFHGRSGRAFLFDSCVNVSVGPAEDRLLMTGLHSVCDLHCKRCGRVVGWTYQRAYEASQKYKEGKFIIEKIHLYVEHPEGEDVCENGADGAPVTRSAKTRSRSHSWGNARDGSGSNMDDDSQSRSVGNMVFEYLPQG